MLRERRPAVPETHVVRMWRIAASPERTFVTKEGAICRDMKLTTLEALRHALEAEEYEITVPGPIMEKAQGAIERMIALHR